MENFLMNLKNWFSTNLVKAGNFTLSNLLPAIVIAVIGVVVVLLVNKIVGNLLENHPELSFEGTDAVVARLNMQFKTPLTSQDEYVCRLNIKKDGIKYVFLQDIFRLPDEKLCVRAQVDTVCITNGKLQTTTPLDHLLEPYFMKEE